LFSWGRGEGKHSGPCPRPGAHLGPKPGPGNHL